jgi:hypothetical protein
MGGVPWKRVELAALVVYALGFYLDMIRRSLRLSHGTAAAAAALTPPVPLPFSVNDCRSSHSCFAGGADYSGRLYGLRAGSLSGHLNVRGVSLPVFYLSSKTEELPA